MEISIQRLAEIIEEIRAIRSGRQTASVVGDTAPPSVLHAEQEHVPVTINRTDGGEAPVEQTVNARLMEQENPSPQIAESRPVESGSPQSASGASVGFPDILSLMTGSEKKKVAKSIFHKDQDEFIATVTMLDKVGSWEEASMVLDDLFLAKDVDPQSRIAILLTEKVYQRFHPVVD
jgi:hypothetical protein